MVFAIRWLGPILAMVGVAIALVALRIAAKRWPTTIRPAGHWSELNRQVGQLRLAVSAQWYSSGVVVAVVTPWLLVGDYGVLRERVVGVLALLLFLTGSVPALQSFVVDTGEPVDTDLTSTEALRSAAWTMVHPALIFATVLLSPRSATWTQILPWAVSALLLLATARFSVSWMRAVGRLRPCGPALDPVQRGLGVQPDRLLELRSNHASAAALRTGEVVFSSAAIAHLSTEQLIAIGRHELHHIDESRRAWAIRLVPVLMAIGFGPAMVLPAGPYVFLIAVLGFGRLFRWWSRRSETRADAAASGHPGDEGVYATALEDFYRLGRIPITSRGSTHPDLHDRLEAVGAKPNYRRPAPPDRVYVLHGLIGSAVVAVLVWVGTLVLVQATAGRTQSYMAVATGQDTEQTLPNLIIQEILEGNHERADELAEFALTEMKPAALESTLVRALDGLGSCDSIQFDTTKVKSPPLSAALAACG